MSYLMSLAPQVSSVVIVRPEVPESSPSDDCPRHSPVSQHPQDQHQHQVTTLSIMTFNIPHDDTKYIGPKTLLW